MVDAKIDEERTSKQARGDEQMKPKLEPKNEQEIHGLMAPGHMERVEIEGVEIAVFDSGGRDVIGAPIMLLHGLGEHAGYWNENVAPLIAARRRVIIPDLAGHGRSGKPRRDYSMSWQAMLMHTLLDHLGVDQPVTLVGHSMGGHIALRFSLEYPDRLHNLVLISPAGIEQFSPEEAAWLSRVSTPASFASRSPSALRAHFKRNVFGRWSRVAQEHLEERLQLIGTPDFMPYIQAVVSSINEMLKDRVAYQLEQITTPIYLLFGAEDRLIPNPFLHGGSAIDVVRLAQKKCRNLKEVILLSDVGHMPQIEAPRRVERLILKATNLEERREPKASSERQRSTRLNAEERSMRATLIKRYPNRRLYDTERSAYITLDDLAEDLSRGKKVKVIESKTAEDITQRIMLHAMLTDQHSHKLSCLPIDFLTTIFQIENSMTRTLLNNYVRVTLSSFSIAQSTMQQNLDVMKKLAPKSSNFIQGLASILTPPSDRS